jgi:hypothetical protein
MTEKEKHMPNAKTLQKITFFVEKVPGDTIVKTLRKIGIQNIQIEEGKFYDTHKLEFKPASEKPVAIGLDGRSGQLRVNSRKSIPLPEKIQLKKNRVGRPRKEDMEQRQQEQIQQKQSKEGSRKYTRRKTQK